MSNSYTEQVVECMLNGHALYGVFSIPEVTAHTAVLIVVGGPQYRVGSHRQFVLLARYLASRGILALRFDYSGMGYSEGFPKQFYEVDEDISVALDLIHKQNSSIKKIFVWGLCDAAAAISYYAYSDSRINGVILLNPWVRSEASHSKALLSNYYQERFFSIAVWKDLLKSPKKIAAAVVSLLKVILKVSKSSISRKESGANLEISIEERANDIPSALLKGLTNYRGKICLILSGSDLTAQEFEQVLAGNEWLNADENKAKTQIYRIDGANHTFSSAAWRAQVEQITADFVL